MNKISSTILFLCFLLFSCAEDIIKIEDNSKSADAQVQFAKTKSGTVEFQQLPNPYALDVMQSVYTQYGKTNTLKPTHLYIRFLPQDSLQLKSLEEDYEFELFSYPLDIEIPEGADYVDPTITEGDFTWLYTTIEINENMSLPSNIQSEILEQCYIPADDEEIPTTKGGGVNVEEAAFLKLGYTVEDEPLTRARRERPEGTIRVYNNSTESLEPLKGVKIRCHRFIKWSTTFTNEDGYYVMDSKFRYNPHYAIVFDNSKDFEIWGNWGPLARANYNMGWQSKHGHNRDFYQNSTAWEWCTVNNGAYDYYRMCELTGITKPPSNLKIWIFKDWDKSSAPMLRRINDKIGLNGSSYWLNFFTNIGYGLTATTLNQLLKIVLPDVTIGAGSNNYGLIYNTVYHELAHASHFSQVGSEYWANYISYIMTYGSYGKGTGKNAELCAVGEMWGYFMEYAKTTSISEEGIFPGGTPSGWIKPHVFWNLYRSNTLTEKQIYDCLSADVDTYDELAAKMYSKYPAVANSIEAAFVDNKITLNVQKPDTGSNNEYIDRIISTNTIFSGNEVYLKNITVTNNVNLTVNATQTVKIDIPFTINPGSTLTITLQ